MLLGKQRRVLRSKQFRVGGPINELIPGVCSASAGIRQAEQIRVSFLPPEDGWGPHRPPFPSVQPGAVNTQLRLCTQLLLRWLELKGQMSLELAARVPSSSSVF